MEIFIARTAEFEIDDQAGIALLVVEDVEISEQSVRVIGAIPAVLSFVTMSSTVRVQVASAPIALKRFFRWRAVKG